MENQQHITEERRVDHRAHVPVECPICHWKYFQEVGIEDFSAVAGVEVRQHLEAWLASRCPQHFGPFMEISKN
jgi:hypothetical protein